MKPITSKAKGLIGRAVTKVTCPHCGHINRLTVKDMVLGFFLGKNWTLKTMTKCKSCGRDMTLFVVNQDDEGNVEISLDHTNGIEDEEK